MYYSIFDGSDYLATGSDSGTEREAANEMLLFLADTSDEPEVLEVMVLPDISDEEAVEFLESLGYEVHGHEERMFESDNDLFFED